MAELFGSPQGQSAAEADIWASRLNNLAMSEGQVRLKQAETTLASQQKMQDLMTAQTSKQQPENLPGMLDKLADVAFQSGLFEQGKQYATSASTIRKNTVDIDLKQATIKQKSLTLYSDLLSGVHDQQSWQQANQMFTMQTGEQLPFAKMPYNPKMVAMLQSQMISAKDKTTMDLNQARTKAEEASTKEREARVPLIRAQTKLNEDRDALLKKTGGKPPTSGEISAITDQIQKDYPDALSKEEMRVLARPLAERARELATTLNLTPSQAATRAYQEAKASKQFAGLETAKPPSGSQKKPLTMPMDSGKIDTKKLKENKFYTGPGGKPYLWTGAAFVPAGTGEGEVSEQDADNSDDDDDNTPAGES